MGTVFLVVTGGEALYADIGHFGTRPIRVIWIAIALPALLLNYLGQGAFLMANREGAVNPFYRMAPEWALYPLVLLATTAAAIASQAVITGAFSLTLQAVQLGYSPRLKIEHTSPEQIGQIYIPASLVEQSRGGVRRVDHDDDGDYHGAVLRTGPRQMAMESAAGHPGFRASS